METVLWLCEYINDEKIGIYCQLDVTSRVNPSNLVCLQVDESFLKGGVGRGNLNLERLSSKVPSSLRRSLSQYHQAMMTLNGTAQTADWESRYYHVDQILDRPGPRTDPSFLAGEEVRQTHETFPPDTH